MSNKIYQDAILLSVKSQWVEKIFNGEKTIEIRKTMPKCELPIKVYIYCSTKLYVCWKIGGKLDEKWRLCRRFFKLIY